MAIDEARWRRLLNDISRAAATDAGFNDMLAGRNPGPRPTLGSELRSALFARVDIGPQIVPQHAGYPLDLQNMPDGCGRPGLHRLSRDAELSRQRRLPAGAGDGLL